MSQAPGRRDGSPAGGRIEVSSARQAADDATKDRIIRIGRPGEKSSQ